MIVSEILFGSAGLGVGSGLTILGFFLLEFCVLVVFHSYLVSQH